MTQLARMYRDAKLWPSFLCSSQCLINPFKVEPTKRQALLEELGTADDQSKQSLAEQDRAIG
jgi:hypothetical protein